MLSAVILCRLSAAKDGTIAHSSSPLQHQKMQPEATLSKNVQKGPSKPLPKALVPSIHAEEEELEFVSPPFRKRKTNALGMRHQENQIPRQIHTAIKTSKQNNDTAAHGLSSTVKNVAVPATENVVDNNGEVKENIGNVEKEELKVQTATLKLVTWLRNRLRKRLGELAELEGALKKLKNVATHFEISTTRAESERATEIRKKGTSQKELARFRLKLVEPDVQLKIVGDQAKKLEWKMQDRVKTYDALGKMQAELESKLREAGFSHWLEARGQRYLPETAVGVLSKSTEILEPVIEGIGKAVAIDNHLAREVDDIIPIVHSPLLTGVVSDVFVLVPLIPVIALAGRITFMVHRMTVVQFIFYLSAVFAAQCLAFFLASVALGEEAIQYFLKANEPAAIASIFLIAGLYSCFLLLHVLTALVDSSARNFAHLTSAAGIGYLCHTHVFRRAVLNQDIHVPVVMHVAFCVAFLFILTDRNLTLGYHFPFQKAMKQVLDDVNDWMEETIQAMKISIMGENETLYIERNEGAEYGEHSGTSPRYAREEGNYYCGTPQNRPLAMGESRGSSFSVATSLHGRSARHPSN